MDKRTHFLFIITDQHRADHLGCYGNAIVKTPAIDRIAETGTRFENFYVATPICMPNRATFMTGRMPSLHGARHNGIPLSMNATTFVDIMGAAGYDTALIGKCHLQSISGDLPTVHQISNNGRNSCATRRIQQFPGEAVDTQPRNQLGCNIG
jgi:arylsulfatase A-like enzyme